MKWHLKEKKTQGLASKRGSLRCVRITYNFYIIFSFFLFSSKLLGIQYIYTSLVAQLVKNPPAIQETLVQFLDWEDLLVKGQTTIPIFLSFPGGSDDIESTCKVGDLGLIPRLGRSPGEGNGYPLQYSWSGKSKNPGEFHGPRNLVGYSPCGHRVGHD